MNGFAGVRGKPTIGEIIEIEGAIKGAKQVCFNRLLVIGSVLMISFCLLGGRLIELSMVTVDNIRTITMPQPNEVKFSRKNVVDRNDVLLSTNLNTESLYATPQKIIDPMDAAEKLHEIIPELSVSKLQKELKSPKGFVWIKRSISPKEQEAVNDLGIPGLYFQTEEKRVYPQGNLVSHVLGMVGTDGKGLSGIEKFFDKELSGLSEKPYERDNLQLSVDVRVQDVLNKELQKAITEFKALGGSAIVMDANNGEVIGMTNLPDFDPNNPLKINAKNTFNQSTLGLYEMGSTFKTFTLAAALESRIIKLSDSFDATKPIRFAGFTISDYHPENRWLNVPEIFMHSSNIGMARIAQELGKQKQKEFLTKVGLLRDLDFEIPEKGRPMLPESWGEIHTMTISYGHGVAVTPLHVVAAMAALVNGGTYHKPTLIKQTENTDGERVLSEKTSKTMRKLLRLVVSEGTGAKAAVDGYLVGGKTGTADKQSEGKYSTSAKLTSFVGAFPINKPRYIVFAMLDEPKGNKSTFGIATAGFTAAPVVSRVISQIAPLLGVEPVDEESEAIQDALKIDFMGRQDIASERTR